MQDLTGLRRDVDERDDANFFSRDAVERQRDLTRPHLHHAHVGALGECELDFGGVLVNEVPTWRTDQMPYGGVRDSGNTREGPAYAVREMTETRLVVVQP